MVNLKVKYCAINNQVFLYAIDCYQMSLVFFRNIYVFQLAVCNPSIKLSFYLSVNLEV